MRPRPLRLLGYAAAALVVVGFLGWVVGFSPVLAVRTVEVVGVPAPRWPPSGRWRRCRSGSRWPGSTARAVAARVAERATVADVSIERSWPSTLVIHASPRQPFLVVKNPQGQLQVVDETGVAYAQVSTPPRGVPTVNAASQAALSRDALAAAVSVSRCCRDPAEAGHQHHRQQRQPGHPADRPDVGGLGRERRARAQGGHHDRAAQGQPAS